MDQKLQSLDQTPTGRIPEEWRERFLIKRIDEDDIEISLEERDGILSALNRGQRFVQVGKYTIMLNAIKSIDPLWGEDNVPPRPKVLKDGQLEDGVWVEYVTNPKELALWDSLFGKKLLENDNK